MSTITSREIIDDIIRNHGKDVHPLDPGEQPDPDVVLVVEYENAYGGTCWGVTWINEDPARQHRYLHASDYIRNPRVIWWRGHTFKEG